MGILYKVTRFFQIEGGAYEVSGMLESFEQTSNTCKQCGKQGLPGARMIRIIEIGWGGDFLHQRGLGKLLLQINKLLSASDWCEDCLRFQFQI